MKSLHLDRDPRLNIIYNLPFGSQIYGQLHSYSDLDVISIVKENTGEFVLRHFDFNDSTYYDRSYVGVNQFIQGLANYSNIEFFESLHTDEGHKFMEAHNLNLGRYYNSRQARAYLGMASRDLKYPNRLKHSLRCIYIAQRIMDKLLFIPKETPTQIKDLQEILKLDTLDGLDELIRTMRGQLVYE